MSESADDRGCSSASSLHADLSKLVIWAHTHGTICNQIPALEFMQNTGHLSNNNTALWMCRVGHAYHWQCGKLYDKREDGTETRQRTKRFLSSESSSREDSFGEKRFRLTPSYEMGQTDARRVGSRGSSPVVAQEADTAYTRNNEPSPSGSQNTRKHMTCSAAEQHLSGSGGRLQTGRQNRKLKNDEEVQIISDEEQCADEDNQGDRISQDNVSEPSVEVDLQVHHCQEMALHQLTTPQRAAFAPMARPPLTRAYILQTPVSDPEDPSRNILRLGPFSPAESPAETSRARSLTRSAASQVRFKPLPVPSTEARAQLESHPSVVFFEFQATADVQQHLQLSPPECGTSGPGSSRDGTENVDEESELTPCPAAIQSPESHPPAASNRAALKKLEKMRSYATGDIKVFKDWLVLHHPSETRKIHTLPPADLDHYLVSFISTAKRQNGMDFSANSLAFFQRSIERYLKYHNYQYSILRGPEFKASQEVWKQKHQDQFQKEREKELSLVENLTDEDVENLLKKGILSKTHPQGLLHLMFTNIIRGFGVSTHSQTCQLYWGQLVLRKTKGEVEYLEWKNDLSPGGNEGELRPRLFAKPKDPENCPVASYKEYATKRPPDMLNDNNPLYLTPRKLCSVWDKVWYSRKALTKNKMEKILKVISQEVGGAIRKTRK